MVDTINAYMIPSEESDIAEESDWWQAVLKGNIIKDGQYWSLPPNITWLHDIKVIYIRKCYEEIADKLLTETEKKKLCLLLGPTGIGKSVFIKYLIVRIVEKARADNALDTLSIIYCSNRRNQPVEIRFTAYGASVITTGRAQYFLSDSFDINKMLGSKLMVNVSSSIIGNHRKFTDRLQEHHGERVHMEEWTEVEMLALKDDECTEEEVNFVRKLFGGNFRAFSASRKQLATEIHDEVDNLAQWLFGLELKQTYPRSWNGAMNVIRDCINVTEINSASDAVVMTLRSFLTVDHNLGFGACQFSTTFWRFVFGICKHKMDQTIWNELSFMHHESGERICFETIGHKTLIEDNVTRVAKQFYPGRQSMQINYFGLKRVLIPTFEDIVTLPNSVYAMPLFGIFVL